ncbi:MAG TPA: SRPBCC family protein [Candidatus Elarobacter sp.]|nr:SRPBCC family protein [Candidatus Elarobacter sp.]
MTRVRCDATIRSSPEDLFDFVTTPAHRPEWHPSSVRVTGDADHSQLVGERCVEKFIVAGRHGECEWTVLEREALHRWVIDARPPAGGGARITYELSAVEGGTHFVRTMDYEMPNAFLELS